MLQNTVIKIMAFILAVVLFTTAAAVCQGNPSTLEVEGENTPNQENDALRPMWAELPEQTHISHSRMRRFMRRQTLREQRPRHAFKRAVRRLFSLGHLREESKGSGVWILDKRSTLRRISDFCAHRVQVVRYSLAVRRLSRQTEGEAVSFMDGLEQINAEHPTLTADSAPQCPELFECSDCGDITDEVDLTVDNAPQCIECFLCETDALTQTREASDKYADCEPVDGLLSDLNPELVQYGNATLRRTFCIFAVIAVLYAFDITQLSFSLAFIGAVRTPKPQWLKDAENSGIQVFSKGEDRNITGRKENTRNKKCAQCAVSIPAGQYFAQLNAVNSQGEPYASLKPHCETCTTAFIERNAEPKAPRNISAPPQVMPPSNLSGIAGLRLNTFKGTCAVCSVEVPSKAGYIHADSPKGHKIRCAEHATEALFIASNGEPVKGRSASGGTNAYHTAEPPQTFSQAVSAQVSASLPSTTQGDKIELLQALLSGDGLNEEQVRSVATVVVQEYAETAIQNGIQNASAHVEERIEKVVSELKAQEVIKTLHIKPSKKAKAVKISGAYHPAVPTVFSILKAGLRSGKALPVYMVGEAGTGKSFAVAQVQAMLQAAKLQSSASYGEIICFADMTRGDLLGNVKYGVGGKGSIEWQRSGLVKPLLEGGVAFVDEIDKADPAVLVLLNGVLASRTIINPATGEVLKVHDEAVIIAAGNTGGHSMGGAYKAAQIQDASLLDRFAATVVKFGFSARIAASMCGLSHAMAEPENSPRGQAAQMSELLKSYTELRGIVLGQTTVQYSNRALAHAVVLAEDGWTLNAIIGRWIEPLDSELRREVLNHFGMIDGEALSLVPQGVFEPESVDIAGGA